MEAIRAEQPKRRKKNDHIGFRKFLKQVRTWYLHHSKKHRRTVRVIQFLIATSLFLLFSKLSPSLGWVYLAIVIIFNNEIRK